MAALPVLVHVMADAARGTVSRRDLTAVGFHPACIDDWVVLGLLERAARGEYRIPGSGRSRTQELATMLWRAGEGARLAGALACGLRRLKGFSEDESQYIAVPHGRHVRGAGYPIVRTRLPAEDHDLIRGLPGVTVERGLIGAAATHRPARVRVAFYDAKFKGLTDQGRVAARATALGRVHGAPQMRGILGTGALTVESDPELTLLQIFRPDEAPAKQVYVEWHGKWFRLDFAFLDARLALEYDGSDHVRTREADADRDLALLELNIQNIRVAKAMLADRDELRRHRAERSERRSPSERRSGCPSRQARAGSPRFERRGGPSIAERATCAC